MATPALAQESATPHDAFQRGVALLSKEVPAWAADQSCYSCHNNSNAAQALYLASTLGHDVPAAATADTSEWLLHPERWKDNGGDPAFADETLANIQFAAALVTAIENDVFAAADTNSQQAIEHSTTASAMAAVESAATLIVADQHKDGYWRINGETQVGTPATLGNTLATREALRTLRLASNSKLRPHIAKAESWLFAHRPKTVFTAAAQLLALTDAKASDTARKDRKPDTQRQADITAAAAHALAIVRRGQSSSGGFGPYLVSQPEPFDTAIAILALSRWGEDEDRSRLLKARDFLLAEQYAEGDWPETTRPAGNESYAQRLSTTGWALLALLEVASQQLDCGE